MPALAQPRFNLATRSASARPTTYRDADRSIEAVAATETPVRAQVYDYQLRQWIECEEVFDISGMTDAEVETFVGCPLLDSHSTWSSLDIVGVIVSAWRENNNTELVVRFSVDETETVIASKVKSGTIRKVSLGAMRKRTGAVYTQREGQVPLRRSPIDPVELSLVAVPADPNASTRSGDQELRSVHQLADQAASPAQEDSMNRDAIRSALSAFTTAMTAALADTPAVAAPVAVLPVVDPDTGIRSAPAPVIAPVAAPAVVTAAPALVSAPVVVAAPASATRSEADLAQIAGYRAVAVTRGKETEFDLFANGGSDMTVLRSMAESYMTSTAAPTSGVVTAPLNSPSQRAEQIISFDEAVVGQRASSGGDFASQLAAALTQMSHR